MQNFQPVEMEYLDGMTAFNVVIKKKSRLVVWKNFGLLLSLASSWIIIWNYLELDLFWTLYIS